MNSSNVPLVTRLKGRNNRGKTAAYYFYWLGWVMWLLPAMAFSDCSRFLSQEETSGDHHDHEKFLRNGGRGMSAEQVEIVEEAFRLHNKKAKSVLNYFRDTALRNPTTDAFILHLIMTLIIKLNLFKHPK